MLLGTTFEVADKNKHSFKNFDCGKPSLNDYLKRFAIKNNTLGLSRTWVLPIPTDADKSDVCAYFTLSLASVERESLPPQTKLLPAYPIPTILLARLAVSVDHRNKQLGIKTLVHALRTAYRIQSNGLPAIGIVIDVLDDDAMNFYKHVGIFTPFSDNPNRLFVHMDIASQL